MQSNTEWNQKFLGIRLFDTPADIGLLPPFFYEYVNTPSENKVIDIPNKVIDIPNKVIDIPNKVIDIPIVSTPPTTIVKDKWFEPRQRDTLFWCVFTAVFGISEYLLIGTKYANREWEEKQSAILSFQKSSGPLRTTNYKITLGKVQEIISEYMTNQSSITLLGLVGLSVHYRIQIYLIDSVKKTHLVYTPENYVQTCYIYRHDVLKSKYRLALDPVVLDDSFCLESFTRPLRAVSTYKMGELVDLAKRFSIEYEAKPKKEDIYRKISEYVVWL
jgi:hypothetical protein